MPTYHFAVGKPTDLLYIDASFTAPTPEAALEMLRSHVPVDVDLSPEGYERAGGYAQILTNRDAIGLHHIDRVDPDVTPRQGASAP